MTGLDALCIALRDLRVRHVFGLPGTENHELFTALPINGIRPVLATHELSASFMANGYARASGRPGVIATVPGPGFAYALPGLAEARLDSVPLLHLVATPVRGPGRFGHQAIDQAGIAGAIAKAVVEVRTAGEMERHLCDAHVLALDGEPGPVVVHLHREALRDRVGKESSRPPSCENVVPEGAEPGWADDLRKLVATSERPVLFAGGGALDGAADLQRLAERLSAPTFTTLTARGVLPEDHRCSIPFDAERGGLGALNDLLDGSDLVLALGCKLSHVGTAGFCLRLPERRLVQVNSDAAALGSSYPASLSIQARVEDVLRILLAEDASGSRSRWTMDEIADVRARISRPDSPRLPEPRFAGVPGGTAEAFFGIAGRVLPRDAIVVTDSGLHQVMTRRYHQVRAPRGLVTPADFQSMGFGIPAAIGAALSVPSRPVVAVVGDGGFLMAAMDLACAARERVPVAVVVFNDGYLNLIRLQQARGDGRGTAVRLDTPDLERLAAAMSVEYGRLAGSMESVLRQALQARGPTLLEVRLGDSAAIQALRSGGLVRWLARRALGDALLDRLKRTRKKVGIAAHRP